MKLNNIGLGSPILPIERDQISQDLNKIKVNDKLSFGSSFRKTCNQSKVKVGEEMCEVPNRTMYRCVEWVSAHTFVVVHSSLMNDHMDFVPWSIS